MAGTSRRSGKTEPHSLNGRLVPMSIDAPFLAFGDDLEQQFRAAVRAP